MKHAFLLSVLLGVVGSTTALAQNATFSVQQYPIVGNTQVAADFNGDGKPDLAGNAGTKAVSVMVNNGDGTFRPRTEFSVGFWTSDVAAGDFNGDGKTDLVATLQDPQLSLAFLPGAGSGSFGAPTFFANPTGFDAPAIVAGDINNDGKLDVVIMNGTNCFTASCAPARTVVVMLGKGDGTFQPARVIDTGTHPTAIALGDFNRDGIKDLAVGGSNTELSILLGAGDGSFVAKPLMLLVPGGDQFASCNDVDVADFNRDGIQDIVVPLGNGNGNVVALGNGDGTFRMVTRYLDEAVSEPQSDAVADFNGDGFLDIARGMADGSRGLVHVLHGNGDGTFQPIARYAVPTTLANQAGGYLIGADFNGDGRPDLALQVRGNGATDIFVNTTGPAAPPTAPTLSTLTLNPASVTGGSGSTGTVTLSAPAQAAVAVQLSSNNAAARVLASVTVPAGAASATFSISTTQVSATTSAQIAAVAGGTSRTAMLTIGATAPTADSVAIARAEYDRAKGALRVEASSSRPSATLQVFVTATGQLIGDLTNNGGGKYSGQFAWSVNPQTITVQSNLGGASSRAVTLK